MIIKRKNITQIRTETCQLGNLYSIKWCWNESPPKGKGEINYR